MAPLGGIGLPRCKAQAQGRAGTEHCTWPPCFWDWEWGMRVAPRGTGLLGVQVRRGSRVQVGGWRSR